MCFSKMVPVGTGRTVPARPMNTRTVSRPPNNQQQLENPRTDRKPLI